MLNRLLATNSTSSTVPTKTLSTTTPAGVGVLKPILNAKLHLKLYGTGSDNQTVLSYVFGWRYGVGEVYHPTLIGAVTGTLSTAVGAVGEIPLNTERYADTLTFVSSSGKESAFEFYSNNANSPGSFVVDVFDWAIIEIVPIVGTATNVNALYEFIS